MSQKGLATALGVTMVFGAGLFAPPALAEVIINVRIPTALSQPAAAQSTSPV